MTVEFVVVGSPADPDFGADRATGVFSFITTPEPGTDVLRPEGFGLDTVSFNWAGVNWTTANADIYRIGWEPDGRLFAFTLGGKAAGPDLSLTSPDFRLAFCIADIQGPDTDCLSILFDYTTPRSNTLGIFPGFMPNLSLFREPVDAPVPEPMTLLLVGSGLGAIAARRRIRNRSAGASSNN